MSALLYINQHFVNRFNKNIETLTKFKELQAPKKSGRLVRVVGLTLEAKGISAPLGAICEVDSIVKHKTFLAEVVGFQNDILYLMPFEETEGVGPGSKVTLISNSSDASVSRGLTGRVLDGLGQPIDGKGPIAGDIEKMPFEGKSINPLQRLPIDEVLDTGIKAINSCLTIGRGQRLGLIAGSGVGKSVLLGMLTRNTSADVVVIGLIGERGREVKEFISNILGDKGLSKAVVIAAPANISPVVRLKATKLTHSIAEYYRDKGKNVLLLLDSLTRVAHAQREIGLSVGEPPTAKGYPPSVFALLPKLIERTGVGANGHGTITSIYTVLAEGDDTSDPVVDIARASLDGQVMLSRKLADMAHYPAIDLAGSVSRVMPSIVSGDRLKKANQFRRLWTLYQQNMDLIQVGAYEPGTNPELDEAIKLRLAMEGFLLQGDTESFSFEQSQQLLMAVMGV